MGNSCARTEILLGQAGMARLAEAHVLIAGLGGVGGACAESLCRAGVGTLTLIDFDIIEKTDLNRQLIALHSTLGRNKVEVLHERLTDINPDTKIIAKHEFITQQSALAIAQDDEIDFIADCIDSIAIKTALIDACTRANKPIIASMGAGGRLDAGKIHITRMDKTHNCALARLLRKQLRDLHNPLRFPVVFSSENAIKALPHQSVRATNVAPSGRARAVNGAISYLPNIFGLMMAGHITQTLLNT